MIFMEQKPPEREKVETVSVRHLPEVAVLDAFENLHNVKEVSCERLACSEGVLLRDGRPPCAWRRRSAFGPVKENPFIAQAPSLADNGTQPSV